MYKLSLVLQICIFELSNFLALIFFSKRISLKMHVYYIKIFMLRYDELFGCCDAYCLRVHESMSRECALLDLPEFGHGRIVFDMS